MNDTFANRLQKALNRKNMKPIELAEKSKIDKSLISNYLSGNYKAKQDKLYILAKILDVNPAWLMGFDVPTEDIVVQDTSDNDFDELGLLFDKNKKYLTESDKTLIRTIIEERKKEIDKELGDN